MAEKTFSTKEICQIFNIGRETLRHYEKVGLIKPAINPGNGYREYSYWDIFTISDILRYRSYGLSLADTKQALFDLDFNKIIETLEEHTEKYTKELIQYELLLNKAGKDLFYLRRAKENMDALVESELPELFLIPFTSDPSNEYFSSMQTSFENSRFFTTAAMINFEDHSKDCNGQMTEKGYAHYLGLDKGITIKQSKVISKMLDVIGKEPVNSSTVLDFRSQISEKYLRTFNTVYIALITRFYDSEKRFHQYFLVFAPLD